MHSETGDEDEDGPVGDGDASLVDLDESVDGQLETPAPSTECVNAESPAPAKGFSLPICREGFQPSATETYAETYGYDAVLERGVALLLVEYRERTAALRVAIDTRRLFLRIDQRGTWVIADAAWIWQGLRLLGDRALLALPDGTLGLTTRLLRRTVATRQVQAGAHIEAIAAQLGHSTTLTTMQYVPYDRMTHATEIREALDSGAKLALLPWDQGPRLLADLPADERARFLGTLPEHDVGVGLCDEATCVMVKRGSAVPPCFLCTHLLTGPEFLPELEELRHAMQAETRGIPAAASFSALQANKRYELECLDRLIDGIQTREDPLGRGATPR